MRTLNRFHLTCKDFRSGARQLAYGVVISLAIRKAKRGIQVIPGRPQTEAPLCDPTKTSPVLISFFEDFL